MNNHIESELTKHCNKNSILNIYTNWSKIVGIETDTKIINENDKYVGKILLLFNGPVKLYLNQIVEFHRDRIKWQNSKLVDGKKLILIDPKWVKSYAPAPKLEVQMKIYDPKSKQYVIEIMSLNYNQFMKRKLIEFCGQFKHIYVSAYENFNKLYRNNQYYFAINSTVKHYCVPQEELVKFISIINNEKKSIKAKWNKYLQIHFQENESAKLIEELISKHEVEERSNNVISIKKTS